MTSALQPSPAERIAILREKVNASAILQSLLYDLDLLPEQIKNDDIRRWQYVACIVVTIEDMMKLLIESRKWQALGEFGDPLGPECWTPEYTDYMVRLDAAIG